MANILYVGAYKEIPGVINPIRKVGITSRPIQINNTFDRMRELSNGTEAYAPVEAIQAWELPENLHRKTVEDYLHDNLKLFGLHTNREWFNGKTVGVNTVETYVESYMYHLIDMGFDVKNLAEMVDNNTEAVVEDNDEKLLIKKSPSIEFKDIKNNGEFVKFYCETPTHKIGDTRYTSAVGIQTEKGFIVLRESKASLEIAPSFITKGYNRKRNQLIESGILVKGDNYYELTEDYTFDSLSAAAAIFKGREANGKTNWSDENGKNIVEYYV